MLTKGLRKHLKTISKKELIRHITELDKNHKQVQEYHHVHLAPELSNDD